VWSLFYFDQIVEIRAPDNFCKTKVRESVKCGDTKMCLHIFVNKRKSEIYRALSLHPSHPPS